jgi:hypothetical protein
VALGKRAPAHRREDGAERTKQACGSALRFGARSYKGSKRLLALGREGVGLHDDDTASCEKSVVTNPDSRAAAGARVLAVPVVDAYAPKISMFSSFGAGFAVPRLPQRACMHSPEKS